MNVPTKEAIRPVKQILLVDDDKSLLRMVQDVLTASGHTVVALSDFQTAKNYLALNVPEAIITDVRLGEFNGLQLVILAKQANPAVRAVVMTGYDDIGISKEAERLGATYLVKPVHVLDLVKFIEA